MCILYDNSTRCESVNDLRMELFPNKVQLMHNLPPTQSALMQHINRCLYQSSILLTSVLAVQATPSPDTFGWTKVDNKWEPLWITKPEAAKSCRQLMKCGCKAFPLCSKHCICRSTGPKCRPTALCHCKGNHALWLFISTMLVSAVV